MRLLVTVLLAVVLRSQHIVSAQCSPQCSCNSPGGSWSPMYKMLTSPPPSENDIVPRAPPRCSCGCSPRRLPPRLPTPPPNTAQQTYGISALSGVVMDSPVFQQVGPATVIQTPPAVYFPSPDDQGGSSYTCDTSSHIMTIPRKQDFSETFTSYDASSNTITTNDDTPTVTYSTAHNAKPAVIFSSTSEESPSSSYSTTPQQRPCQPLPSNSVMNAPQTNFLPPPPPPPPRPMYFTQPAPLYASCPATLFYPASPSMTCPQPNIVYPAPPSYPSTSPTISQSFTPGPSSNPTYSSTDNIPTTTYSMTPSQDLSCNAPQSNNIQPSQTFPTVTFQNTPSNTVTFSSSDTQQTPTSSVTCNTNSQQAPSTTIFFRDSESTDNTGSVSPETTSPTVTSHDAPLTYTLLTSGTNNGAMDANRDCSVPVPPVLV